MENLHRLLFELASNERMKIMFELQNQKLKLSQISKKLSLTAPETFRQLERLSEDQLIQKNTKGEYGLTHVGTLALCLLSGLRVISKHKNFFLEYDVTRLPYQFLSRIGELEEGEYVPETLTNLEEGEKRIREAKKFTWILSEQILTSSIPSLAEKLKSPFDLRIILPDGKFPKENQSRLPSVMGVQKRVLPKVDFIIVMTEKFAVFCPPNQNGKIDYTGFIGENPKFHNWCKDLFLHYWEKAKPLDSNK